MVASIVVMFALVHPEIVSNMFNHLSCRELDDGNYYLISNYSIQCYDAEHVRYIYTFVIPSIILWVIGIPAILLYILIKRKKKLAQAEVKGKLGFFFNGYKPPNYLWEFLIIGREIAVISVAVLL